MHAESGSVMNIFTVILSTVFLAGFISGISVSIVIIKIIGG